MPIARGACVTTETATQFAWRTLAFGAYPPAGAPGHDAICWLCGGGTGGVGWPWREAIPQTYTNHTLAKVPTSTTVCQACAALGSKATWERYVAAHPEQRLKSGHAMSWRCYSHLFTESGHECPSRARWREILLDPPEPPFLAVVAVSGQKHLIFRARVSYYRDAFPVQLEETQLYVNHAYFSECLVNVEALLALGCRRKALAAGVLESRALMALKPDAAVRLVRELTRWRQSEPGLLELVLRVAHDASPKRGVGEEGESEA